MYRRCNRVETCGRGAFDSGVRAAEAQLVEDNDDVRDFGCAKKESVVGP